MQSILISLPQIEWSCFLLSHVRNTLQKHYSIPISCDVLKKNTIDVETFPFVHGNNNLIDMCSLSKSYDVVVNLDPDPLLSSFLSSNYNNVINIQGLIYEQTEFSVWESISKAFGVQYFEPLFRLNFTNRVKSNRSDSGVAIRDDSLRMFVKNAFFADNSRLWHIPMRKDLTKRYDECSAVKKIVTDDIFCALSSFSMSKDVVFLKINNSIPDISVTGKIHVQDISDFKCT